MKHSMNTPSTSVRRRFAALARTARRTWRDCRGSLVVEFALLAPVLLAIFFAIIQFGFVMFTRQEMLYAAREAARSYSVGLNDAEQARQLALSLLNPDNKADIPNYTVSVIEPDGSSVGGDGGNGGTGKKKKASGGTDSGVTGDVTVIITVPMAEASLVHFLEDNILSGNIEASATMFVQGLPEVVEGTTKNKATAKSGTTKSGTTKGGDGASFNDYVNGGNRFV